MLLEYSDDVSALSRAHADESYRTPGSHVERAGEPSLDGSEPSADVGKWIVVVRMPVDPVLIVIHV